MRRRILCVVLAVMCAVTLGACGLLGGGNSPEVAIVGDWQCNDNSQPHIWMCTLSFTADGRFVDRDGDWGDFRISGNLLTLDFDDFETATVNFRLRGNRLTLTGDGLRIVLQRV